MKSVENENFETMDKSWRNYMLAVRGYLLHMGEIEADIQSLWQLAAEMEGNALVYLTSPKSARCFREMKKLYQKGKRRIDEKTLDAQMRTIK